MRQTDDRRDHLPAIFARNGGHRHGTGIKAFYPRAFGKQQIKPSQHQMMIAHLPDPCGGPRARTKFGTMAGTDQASLQAGQANRVLGRQKQRRLIANGTGRKPDAGKAGVTCKIGRAKILVAAPDHRHRMSCRSQHQIPRRYVLHRPLAVRRGDLGARDKARHTHRRQQIAVGKGLGGDALQNNAFPHWKRQQRVAVAVICRHNIPGAHRAAVGVGQITDIQLIGRMAAVQRDIKIGNRVMSAPALEYKPIIARPARQCIIACPAAQRVVARPARLCVIASATIDRILACAAIDNVLPAACVQAVIAGAARHMVVAVAAITDRIIATGSGISRHSQCLARAACKSRSRRHNRATPNQALTTQQKLLRIRFKC